MCKRLQIFVFYDVRSVRNQVKSKTVFQKKNIEFLKILQLGL